MTKDQSEKDGAINLDPLVRVFDFNRLINYAVKQVFLVTHLDYGAPLACLAEHAASHLSYPRALLLLIIVEVLHESPQLVLLPLQPLLCSPLSHLNFGVYLLLLLLIVGDMRRPLLIFTDLVHGADQREGVGLLRFLVVRARRRGEGVLPFGGRRIKVGLLVVGGGVRCRPPRVLDL